MGHELSQRNGATKAEMMLAEGLGVEAVALHNLTCECSNGCNEYQDIPGIININMFTVSICFEVLYHRVCVCVSPRSIYTCQAFRCTVCIYIILYSWFQVRSLILVSAADFHTDRGFAGYGRGGEQVWLWWPKDPKVKPVQHQGISGDTWWIQHDTRGVQSFVPNMSVCVLILQAEFVCRPCTARNFVSNHNKHGPPNLNDVKGRAGRTESVQVCFHVIPHISTSKWPLNSSFLHDVWVLAKPSKISCRN